jgi:hypothetical protein
MILVSRKVAIDLFARIPVGYNVELRSLYNLDRTIAQFVLPHLEAFVNASTGHRPSKYDAKVWENILGEIIMAFRILANDDAQFTHDEQRIVDRGLKLFSDNYPHLWF